MELSDKIENFKDRLHKSKDKAVFLENEIKYYELLFDEKNLPLSTQVITSNRPTEFKYRYYLNTYTHHDIVLIREAYQRYIVNGDDSGEKGELYFDKKDMEYKRRPLSSFQMHYYNEVNMLFEYLKFLKDKSGIISSTSDYTVKSILMTYYYMHRKEIYLLPEMKTFPWVLKKIHFKLHQIYSFSENSFKNDWNPIFGKEEGKNNRLNSPENINLAIKLLRTFDDPNIKEAIELAESEFMEAELLKS